MRDDAVAETLTALPALAVVVAGLTLYALLVGTAVGGVSAAQEQAERSGYAAALAALVVSHGDLAALDRPGVVEAARLDRAVQDPEGLWEDYRLPGQGAQVCVRAWRTSPAPDGACGRGFDPAADQFAWRIGNDPPTGRPRAAAVRAVTVQVDDVHFYAGTLEVRLW